MVAKRNSKYLIKKIDEGMKESEVSSQAVKGKKAKLLQKFCSSSIEVGFLSTSSVMLSCLTMFASSHRKRSNPLHFIQRVPFSALLARMFISYNDRSEA